MSVHDYGPHREGDAPQTVTVYPIVKWPDEVDVPIPAALQKQRERINALAYLRRSEAELTGRIGHESGPDLLEQTEADRPLVRSDRQ